MLIKINERVLNQDGVLIKVNERNNSDIIKVHARAHARTRAEPYTPCSVGRCRVIVPCARFGDAAHHGVQRFRFAPATGWAMVRRWTHPTAPCSN